ncbi:hypothetical protein QBC46DRAFT_441324 [Diplogelasinospora grovesii]|uniref:FAD dependent oxidoreductase domain-containing protein n=1 Tax=Diplogelasinospora grovesii TaxID=303347 RepID=A0AAN6N341_9PEZI|nr:hypothetical protein QBC46DRAFT_441324 [Diplogelasinospora grovesii]
MPSFLINVAISALRTFARRFLCSCGGGTESNGSPLDPAQEVVDIVIVGGGVIGLCIAYNLAKEREKAVTSVRWNITVLEARDSVFAAASSHNTGCLHYDFHDSFGSNLIPLGRYSFEQWQSIAMNDAQFSSDTGCRPQSFFPITPGASGGDEEEDLPNWIKMEKDWVVDWGSKGPVNATVTSTTIVAASLTKSGTIQGIKCASSKSGDTYSFPCQKLILAAGPWTPSQVKTLFPDSTLDLRPSTNAGDWVIFQNPNPMNDKTTAVVFFDDIVRSWNMPGGTMEDEPNEEVIVALLRYSERFIRRSRDSSEKRAVQLQVKEKGRAFRPFTEPGLPIISAIPARQLVPSSSSRTRSVPSNVFICFGHGSYGVTLGMGSGKLMAQVVRGETPDIDLTKFTLE